jgi:hypothetical protein
LPHQEHDAGNNGEKGKQVAAIGKSNAEEGSGQNAEQNEQHGQQDYTEIVGQFQEMLLML